MRLKDLTARAAFSDLAGELTGNSIRRGGRQRGPTVPRGAHERTPTGSTHTADYDNPNFMRPKPRDPDLEAKLDQLKAEFADLMAPDEHP